MTDNTCNVELHIFDEWPAGAPPEPIVCRLTGKHGAHEWKHEATSSHVHWTQQGNEVALVSEAVFGW